MVSRWTPLLEALDHAIGLEGGHDEVEQPQGEQKRGRDDLRYEGSTQLAADRLYPPHQQHQDHHAGFAAEQRDGEGQAAKLANVNIVLLDVDANVTQLLVVA